MSDTGIKAQAVESPVCPLCGAALPLHHEPLTDVMCTACFKTVMMPGRLGQYHLLRLIGKGGMGAVYEGIDTGLQRKIAVKVILREKVDEDPTFLDSFKREAQAAARLNSTHIVGVYAFGESDGQPYLVMELVQPDALDKMMKDGPLPANTVLSIGREIAQGLKVAAESGMVHGDVKPENILINESREAKLADFGIVALVGAQAAANNEVWGTPYYIAPETLRKQKVDLRADIYSLGATLYHAIAGEPPFEGATAVDVMKGRLMGPAPSLMEKAPHCPENIAKIIMRMLEAEPIRRYPNYDSLIADITKEIGESRTSAKRVTLRNARGKTVGVPGVNMPSRPMPAVTNPNAPLFKKEGLSKKAIIGIASGVAALVIILFTLIGLVLAKALKGEEVAPAEGAADMLAVTPAEDPSVAQAAAQLANDAQALTKLVQDFEQRYVNSKSEVKTVVTMVARMAKRAERAVMPEHTSWLSAQEGEAPTEMLGKLQEAFTKVRDLEAVVTAQEALRTKLSDLQVNAENASAALASAQEALAAHNAQAEVKAYQANLKALQVLEKNWPRIVSKGRADMEATVKARQKAEEKARIAERERLAAEQAKREIEEEVASVATIEIAVVGDLDKFMPETALNTYNSRVARLKSTEAKNAAKVVAERIEVFQTLKDFLIAQAKAGKFAAYGVTNATPEVIMLNGKDLTWLKFASNQQTTAFRILKTAIADDVTTTSIRASDRAKLAVGAHIFVTRYFGAEMVKKSKSLRETMEKFEKLANSLPGTRETFKRLVGEPEEDVSATETETPAADAETADEDAE